MPPAGREGQRKNDSHCRKDSERVPVADRTQEPVTGDRIEPARMIGEEPRRQRVPRDQRDCDTNGTEQVTCGPPTEDRCSRKNTHGIEHVAFDLQHGARV